MAGSYVDVPGRRMAYDRDGSIGVRTQNGFAYEQLTQGQLAALNDENPGSGVSVPNSAGGTTQRQINIIFPELRDIVGYLAYGVWSFGGSAGPIQTSVDTTNGVDGTWVQAVANFASTASSRPVMRTGIQALSLSGIRAIRFNTNVSDPNMTGTIHVVHLYGAPSTGQAPDRLRIWHPTLDQEVGPAYFDWGDIRQASSTDRQFRLKNNSSTLTARTISVTTDAPSDTSPSVAAQHLLSLDGTTFTASVIVPDIAPGALSGILTLRRATPSNAALSLWWARVFAAAGSWT